MPRPRQLAASLLAVTVALLSAGCREQAAAPGEESPAPWFVEVAGEVGLDFEHRSGHDGRRYLLPESAAGGGALFDSDGDGWLDVYIVQSAAPAEGSGEPVGNRLFRNLGGRRFADVTAASGAGDGGYGMGVTTGDYDGDGDADLYVTNVGANVLLRNDGPGVDGVSRFTDVTSGAGVGDAGFGASAAFFDYDRDGDLDLWVVNYVVWTPEIERECRNALGEPDYCDPTEYDAPAPDVLYRNDGAGADGVVRFTDVSREAGLDGAFGNGLGVVTADFDGDGRPDVFVANDRMPDHLWLQRGGGRFEERGLVAGCAIDDDGLAKAGMGVAAEDLDDDGDPDLLVVNFRGESDSLFRNEEGSFVDVTARSGLAAVSRAFTRFGVGLVDFDNDGLLDLYQATGRVARQAPSYGADPYAEPDLLLRGRRAADGWLSFEPVEPRGGTAEPRATAGRAAAFGDVDNDGDVDVLVVDRDGPARLLRNVAGDAGRSISLRVIDRRGSDAIGARVELLVGERRLTREVRAASSYCAASDPRIHVGLGNARRAQGVRVLWPDGSWESFGELTAGEVAVLRRGSGANG